MNPTPIKSFEESRQPRSEEQLVFVSDGKSLELQYTLTNDPTSTKKKTTASNMPISPISGSGSSLKQGGTGKSSILICTEDLDEENCHLRMNSPDKASNFCILNNNSVILVQNQPQSAREYLDNYKRILLEPVAESNN